MKLGRVEVSPASKTSAYQSNGNETQKLKQELAELRGKIEEVKKKILKEVDENGA